MSNYPLEIEQIHCLSDNYAVLVHDEENDLTFLVDAPEASPILQTLNKKGWKLTHIFLTHHHWDHIGGLEAIKDKTGAQVYGPALSMDQIEAIDHGLSGEEEILFGEGTIYPIPTPGHTSDHLCYWLPEAELGFTGDALFSMGCGRIFEGDAHQMWESIEKLAKLPPETRIYCGHEYSQANAEFCLSIEPENTLLAARYQSVKKIRAEGKPSLPTSMLEELATNTFLRTANPEVKAALEMQEAEDWEVFAKLREMKNNF